MGLTTPKRIERFQRKLYTAAAENPARTFYTLWDKITDEELLSHAFDLQKAKHGAPGVDGETFELIEAQGEENWLERLQHELMEENYKPKPVRRVYILKSDGGLRPLSIPCTRDRVVQTALAMALTPIFEADFTRDMYGYRPAYSALSAIEGVLSGLRAGEVHVLDADIKDYFGSIEHAALLRLIRHRITDGKVLHLCKLFLKAPVWDSKTGLYTGGKKSKKGTPQGGVISPLFANIFMNPFLTHWQSNELHISGRPFVYADDIVILCRNSGNVAWARIEVEMWMRNHGLMLNQQKTQVVNASSASFDFLGYTFGPNAGIITAAPSSKAVIKLKDNVSTLIKAGLPAEETVLKLSNILRGWAGYFCLGDTEDNYRDISTFVARNVSEMFSEPSTFDNPEVVLQMLVGHARKPAEAYSQSRDLLMII